MPEKPRISTFEECKGLAVVWKNDSPVVSIKLSGGLDVLLSDVADLLRKYFPGMYEAVLRRSEPRFCQSLMSRGGTILRQVELGFR